jgi:hypothetical protein
VVDAAEQVVAAHRPEQREAREGERAAGGCAVETCVLAEGPPQEAGGERRAGDRRQHERSHPASEPLVIDGEDREGHGEAVPVLRAEEVSGQRPRLVVVEDPPVVGEGQRHLAAESGDAGHCGEDARRGEIHQRHAAPEFAFGGHR